MEGTSFAYTFGGAETQESSRHTTQYFEMMGQWALYHEGWLLSTEVNRAPWEAYGEANPDPLNNRSDYSDTLLEARPSRAYEFLEEQRLAAAKQSGENARWLSSERSPEVCL